ncbi:sulfolipid-1 biosynthesis phthioceranic/hydroxyphthioceranic acid synthase [Mycobacterium vicinigordonae]
MACRLPGGVDSPEKFWRALLRGDDLVTDIPPDRWDADELYDPEPGMPCRSVSRWGGFLDDVTGFDPEFFGISEREATAIDPQHRLLMQTSWEAVEHAGIPPKSLEGSSTAVFVGLCHDDYTHVTNAAGALGDAYGFTGTAMSMASGRVSYALGLSGPSLTVDTACSSSLVAVHMACRSLHEKESDLALAGGCMVMLEPQLFASASGQGMLSATGRCRSFDADADGFVRSEGCAVLLLKRLPDAVRDGDRILAVLRGTATNQDGRTDTITTPSLDAQVAVYRAALTAAGVDADTVGLVEAHGTGTPVGDPIEFRSLARVYGLNRACALGSAKSNLGHTEAAAGVVGIIKAVLSLQHGVFPAVAHFTQLPEELTALDTGLFVPRSITPWPGAGPRRAAVSSYGMSGTNAHAILEQAPVSFSAKATQPRMRAAQSRLGSENQRVFTISASSACALRETARRLAAWVDENQPSATDLAYTLARRRAHRPVRKTLIARDSNEFTSALIQFADSDDPLRTAVGLDHHGPVWVFSGQGSQWAAMGAHLLATEPVFAATVAATEPLVAAESGFSVAEAMTAPQTVTGIDRVQPTLFAMQVALAEALQAYGVRPGAVIGHSLGEVSAAVVAGALSLADGVKVICRRSRLCTRLAGAGAMAAVELPAPQVREELTRSGVKDVVIAVVAAPQSTVIGGATESVRRLVTTWTERDVLAREVAVDVASHTPQVNPILDELAEALADLKPQTPQLRYYSATLFDPREQPRCDAGYWVDNLRHAVRFSAAVKAACEDGHRVFGELSPHPLLVRAVEQTAASLDVPVAAIAAMRREQRHGLCDLVGELHSAGAAVDFAVLHANGRLVDAPLPAWANRPLLLDVRKTTQNANTVAAHPLLGAHVRLREEPPRHAWQADIGTAALPWLADHRINDVAAVPGAAFCEMALAAAAAVFGDRSEVHDISFDKMLLLDEETPVGAVAVVEPDGTARFAVETDFDGEKIRRATATLHRSEDDSPPRALDTNILLARHPCRIDGEQVRGWFSNRGIQFGPGFAGLKAAHVADGLTNTVLAELTPPRPIRTQQACYMMHPALLDACFQSVAAHPALRGRQHAGLLLPLRVRRLRVHAPTNTARYCRTTVTACGTDVQADIDVLDDRGNTLLTVRGLLMGTGRSEADDRERLLSERLLEIEWNRRELVQVAATAQNWLLVSLSPDHDEPFTAGLSGELCRLDTQCTTLSWPGDPADLRSRLAEKAFDGVVVVAAPDIEDPLGTGQIRDLIHIARELPHVRGAAPRLYLVTRNALQVTDGDAVNVSHGALRGLLRVIGAEHPYLHPTQIDVDNQTNSAMVAHQLLSGTREDETAWRNDQWWTARLRPAPLRPEERATTTVHGCTAGLRLRIRTPGDLQSIECVKVDRTPPGRGQIEVAVNASSVNFADVLAAFDRYPDFDGRRPELGLDFAGVVSAVGPDVDEHRIGSRVGGMTPGGCWGSYVTCDAALAAPLPKELSDAAAAAVTTAAATAWYALNNLAQIRADDRVLVHSATGGVGQAAIAIARAFGARVYATAGSPWRREKLRDIGIHHVYDSRSTEFAEQIRHDTDGCGVDIVLNSLTGAAQRAGIDVLAFGGRFIEIGKRDIYGDTQLGLFALRRNISLHVVDLALMARTHPRRVRALLDEVYRLTADGTLPAPQRTHYPVTDAAAAVRAMSAAEHSGKLILDISPGAAAEVVVPPEQLPVCRPDGSYLITGGLGGLGLFLAEQLAAAGAGRIVLSSRTKPSQKNLETIELVRTTGADVVVACGDIAHRGTAQRLVAVATATGLPLKGVLHAAAVVEDATLPNITDELLERDWTAKTHGAWNLHHATASAPLDWFCLFSSAAALFGSPGQGAYAAANSWLDSFAHWRRAQGWPATVIAWGAWAEIGRGAILADTGDTTMITPDEGAYAFQALLRHTRCYTGYTPSRGSPWLQALAERSPFAEMFRAGLNTGSRHNGSQLHDELIKLPGHERPSLLRRLISDQVSQILRRGVDPDRPLSDYGLDSLGNLELRTRLETETGIRCSSTDITTVRDLADQLCQKLTPTQDAPVSM